MVSTGVTGGFDVFDVLGGRGGFGGTESSGLDLSGLDLSGVGISGVGAGRLGLRPFGDSGGESGVRDAVMRRLRHPAPPPGSR
ncbi:hypothetical protein [Microbacterium elymi]|uniref:Pentapeptide repeat-containing protein n=1 Tax=Microbacterium elymi TaxID=2909587 RepID=A0ABY5NL63_9MICO|nr:hypothetical protein [Microbacterium elymi]UUT35890.1 hypothetical protein L2X98_22290 [Microbacterium elymi]